MNASVSSPHEFHIPVMGLGYTIDTPLKVARFGISSAVSIMDDQLVEQMRIIHCRKLKIPYQAIPTKEIDYRAKRIRAYLDLLHTAISDQMERLKSADFNTDEELNLYFEMLSAAHPQAIRFREMKNAPKETIELLQQELKDSLVPGQVDVNIMTKVDRLAYDPSGHAMPREFSDALAALRGFALSKLRSSVIFSAGLNPALYSYLEAFDDFFPDNRGDVRKRVILKVSDYRSALIQGKFLAKKGILVSEFRVESGLNCGGHVFATEGVLMGPILEEFKQKREELNAILLETCRQALTAKGKQLFQESMKTRITFQGGIGSAQEQKFLMEQYQLDGTGWGSPFLLVPEATNVDRETMEKLIHAKKSDYFLSQASPLGVPFNNLRNSSGEVQRQARIAKNRPGSPCYKKFLSSNTEFTDKPICTSSRQYQHLKLKQLRLQVGGEEYNRQAESVLAKDCLCEGLAAPALLAQGIASERNLNAVTICPGPNLAYFKGVFKLKDLVGHIYGKAAVLVEANRPHVLIKELQLYMDYWQKELGQRLADKGPKWELYLERFKSNLMDGIQYYQSLVDNSSMDGEDMLLRIKKQLLEAQQELTQYHVLVKTIG